MASTSIMRPYEKFTLEWAGVLSVEAVSAEPTRYTRYHSTAVLRDGEKAVQVALVQEDESNELGLKRLYSLRGVVLGCGSHERARLLLNVEDQGVAVAMEAKLYPESGLNVKGRGLVLNDSVVTVTDAGSVWRVAVLKHKEWDSEEFDVDYIYENGCNAGAVDSVMVEKTIVRVVGEVVNMAGREKKMIVSLLEWSKE